MGPTLWDIIQDSRISDLETKPTCSKLTEAERDALVLTAADEPYLIYNMDAHKYQWWDGISWNNLG